MRLGEFPVEHALADEFSECESDSKPINGIEVVNGKPAEVILESAYRYRSDLIVLGSSSQPTEKPTLGSVASRVLSQSDIPVFLVPMVKLQNPKNLKLYG